MRIYNLGNAGNAGNAHFYMLYARKKFSLSVCYTWTSREREKIFGFSKGLIFARYPRYLRYHRITAYSCALPYALPFGIYALPFCSSTTF